MVFDLFFQEDDMIVGFVHCAGETDCILVVNLFVNSPLFTFAFVTLIVTFHCIKQKINKN